MRVEPQEPTLSVGVGFFMIESRLRSRSRASLSGWIMNHTIVSLFKQRVNELGGRPALGHQVEGVWVKQSWRDWWAQAESVAAGLVAAGVAPGERVAVLSQTRVEWAWVELGILMSGATIVPIYPASSPEDCASALEESEVRLCFAADPLQLKKLLPLKEKLPGLKRVVYFDPVALLKSHKYPGSAGERQLLRLDELLKDFEQTDQLSGVEGWLESFEAFIASGRRHLSEDLDAVGRRRREIQPEDLVGIFYTAGTTGAPRGVAHTHQTLLSAVRAFCDPGFITREDRQLLFLPMARLFSRILFYAGIYVGAEAIFARSLERALGDFRQTQPTFVGVVPRVLQTIYEHVLSPQATQLHGQARMWHAATMSGLKSDGAIFQHALRRGRYFSQLEQEDQRPNKLQRVERRLYNRLVFRRVRELFGGALRFIFCGGAALDPLIAESFHAAGLLVLESYGLTETGSISTLNQPGDFRSDSAGRALAGVDITIAPDQEILVRGPTLARGYQRRVDEQQHCPDTEFSRDGWGEDGWFHTGDLGYFDLDGFLYITGRKGHLISTQFIDNTAQGEGGRVEQVLPEQIERALQRCALIARAVVYSEDSSDPGAPLKALITLNAAAETWAIQRGIFFETRADLAGEPSIYEEIERALEDYNQGVEAHLQVQSFRILSERFSRDARELTATGKLRRDQVLARYTESK